MTDNDSPIDTHASPRHRPNIGLVPDFVMDTTEKSGIDIFSSTMVEQLVKHDPTLQFTLFINDSRTHEFSNLPDRVKIVKTSRFFAMGIRNIFWYLFILPILVRKHKVDLLHVFAANRRIPLVPPRKMLATVHDVFHYHHRKLYTFPRYLFFRGIITPLLKRQQHIHAISHETKRELMEYLKVPEPSIDVVYIGIPLRLTESQEHETSEAVKERFCINGPYILYVSSIDHPRKNHKILIDAYEILLKKRVDVPPLLFAGPNFFQAEVIHEEIRSRGLSKIVRALGYVPDSTIANLYRNATLFVHPSTLEGYGYPLVEAMLFGLPVLCADTQVFREIGGDAPIFFNPSSAQDVAEKIEQVLSDQKLQTELSAKGREQAKRFEINECTSRIIQIYKTILSK